MKKIFFLTVVLLLSVNMAMAVVADSTPRDVKQSDGTILTVRLLGDERVSWIETSDGYTVLADGNGDYFYAVRNEKGSMVRGDRRAHNPSFRSKDEEEYLSNLGKYVFYSPEQISILKQYFSAKEDFINKSMNRPAYGNNGDSVENYKMVVILMSFADYAFTLSRQEVDDLFNQVGYSKDDHPGSVHDYFAASSFNKLNLSAKVVGPYTSDSVLSYYGAAGTGLYEGVNDMHVGDLISEAVHKANNDVNFAEFTNGGGDYVSCVYVIYAGYAQSSNANRTELIWPHRSKIYPPIYVDGVNVSDYGCSSENPGWYGNHEPLVIGTICHEFSHVLGQPDYYDTDYDEGGNAFHPNQWDIMAAGNYNGGGKWPPLWSAMERTVRNYITLQDIYLNEDVTLPPLQYSNKAYKINYSSQLVNEYFILENRQQFGWDRYLPGHGMLIFRVDPDVAGWVYNCSNCNASDLGYELMIAGGQRFDQWGVTSSAAQPFPGTTNATSFTDNTTPSSSLSKDSIALNKPIYRISQNNVTNNITFHVGDTIYAPNIKNFTLNYVNGTLHASAEVANLSSVNISERGFAYSYENIVPTIEDDTVRVQSSSSLIETDFSSLNNGTIYYIRPYVKSQNSYYYGEAQKILIPCQVITMFPYICSFEDGQTECWEQEYEYYIANNWKSVDTAALSGSIGTAHSGNKFAYVHTQGTMTQSVKLITPMVNISSLTTPILKFYHHQKSLSGIQDNLNIYYRTSPTSSWTLIKTFTSSINTWTKDSIVLPNASSTYFLAFESEVSGGCGIGLDDVEITDNVAASWPVVTIEPVSEVTDNSARFTANVSSTGNTPLTEKGFVYSTSLNPTLDDNILTSTDLSLGTYSLVANGLENSMQYYVRAYAKNSSLMSYSNNIVFTARCPRINTYPYIPNLQSTDTTCFENTGEWYVDAMDGSYAYSSLGTNKLILPIFDLEHNDSINLEFAYKQNTLSVDTLKVYYRSSVTQNFILLSEYSGSNTQYQNITLNIATSLAQSPTAYIAFEAVGTNGGKVNVKNIALKSVRQIPTVEMRSAELSSYNTVTINSDVVSEGMSAVTQRGVCYSKNPSPTINSSIILSGNGGGVYNSTISSLDTMTTYYFRSFATNSYGTAYSEEMSVSTLSIPIVSNVISDNQEICSGTLPDRINGTVPTGGDGNYTYLWIESLDSLSWHECEGYSPNYYEYYDPSLLNVTTYYARIVVSGSSVDTSNVVKITIYSVTGGGNVFMSSNSVKQTQPVYLQVRGQNGSVVYWEKKMPGYDWVIISNTEDSTHITDTPMYVGDYSYRALVKNGVCNAKYSGEGVVEVTENIGLNHVSNKVLAINISPNPSEGIIYISCGEHEAFNADVLVKDLTGKEILNKKIYLSGTKMILDLSFLNSGTYIINVLNNKGAFTQKIVIKK